MKDLTNRLWEHMDKHRGTAPTHELLAKALVSLDDIDITPELLDQLAKRFGSEFSGSHLSSAGISGFIAQIAGTKNPKSVLDPTCGSGLLLKIVADHVGAAIVHGIEINEAIVPVSRRLLGEKARVFHGDALSGSLPILPSYDLIISEPPFKAPPSRPLRLVEMEKEIRGDFSDILAAWTCTKLSKEGMAILILPSAFLWSKRSEAAKKAMADLGCAVTGCIQLPSGSLQGTTIDAYIVIIERGAQSDLFVAQYTTDQAHQRVLIENLVSRKEGHRPAQGRLCSWSNFRGYASIEAQDRILRMVKRLGFDPVPMSTLVVEATKTNTKSFEQLETRPNSVYLPLAGRGKTTATQEGLSERLRDYVQLQLDPNLADARFVAYLLNRELGQAILDTIRIGTTIERIRPTDLLASTFYLPPLKIQKKVLSSLNQIAAIRGVLDDLKEAVWIDPRSIDETARKIESVNREDSFEDWIETLPFPLATILWRHHAAGSSVRDRTEILLHFFEALAGFIATVHLSAFSSDSEIWSQHSRPLFEALDKQHLSLERATFGSWKCVTEYLGARCRKLANQTPDIAFSLYRTHNIGTLHMLGSAELITAIQRANGMRNDLRHGGALGDQQAESVHAELFSLVHQCRGVLGSHWLDYELVQPRSARFRNGIAEYDVRRLMGTKTPFVQVNRESVDQLDEDKLYLLDPNGDRALGVLPFVRMMPSPRTEQNACYFFNRIQDGKCRYISYYFDDDPDLVATCADTMDTIAQLQVTAPFKGSKENG